MTEPLSPSQEAAVQEALTKILEERCGPQCAGCTWPILRDLARRLLEPVDILGRRRDGAYEPANPQEKSE